MNSAAGADQLGMANGSPDNPTFPDTRSRRVGDAAQARFAESPGDVIGNYTLVQKLGEGGFGVVWLADRITPMSQRVALKILKPEMESEKVIARFEQERATLAAMEHPNIARVFDAGLTPGGRPYFVMEYVKGAPLTTYCDRERLDVDKRLRLFEDVCGAVHHAHQRGVIHRDLKPGNVLATTIDGQAVVKVIDFGIAKATHPGARSAELMTQHGQFIGTPEYMSPEQAEGAADIDLRTDVYALGVILYELLSGALPIDPERLRSAAMHEMVRLIREQEPERLGTRLAGLDRETSSRIASSRALEPDRLRRVLASELEWIPLKALRKERARRYDSARELSDDIGRFLRSQPLHAGPESIAYRSDKFVTRHARVIGVAIMLVSALLIPIFGDIAFFREQGFKPDARGFVGAACALPATFALGVALCLIARVRDREPTAGWAKICAIGALHVAMAMAFFAISLPALARQDLQSNLAEYSFQLRAFWWMPLLGVCIDWALLVFWMRAPRAESATATLLKHLVLWGGGLLTAFAADVSASV